MQDNKYALLWQRTVRDAPRNNFTGRISVSFIRSFMHFRIQYTECRSSCCQKELFTELFTAERQHYIYIRAKTIANGK